jgi:hypothetical protein
MDEPSLKAKYNDSAIIDEVEKAYPVILGEINRNLNDGQITCKIELETTVDTGIYIIPSSVGQIISVYKTDGFYGSRNFIGTRNQKDLYESGVWRTGNILNVSREARGGTIVIEYAPIQVPCLHYGVIDTISQDGKELILPSEPTKGSIDSLDSAYTGSVLRILSSTEVSTNISQERVISGYSAIDRKISIPIALSPIPSGDVTYEICPNIHQSLDDVIAAYVGKVISSIEGDTKRYAMLDRMYMDRIRNLRLSSAYNRIDTSTQVQPIRRQLRRRLM